MDAGFYDRSSIQLTVIICTFNRHELLSRAIQSIERQKLRKWAFELIVVDNSDDDLQREKFAETFRPDLNCLYYIETRKGLSIARNRGVEYASGPIVAFLDDDAIADEEWATAIIKAFERSPKVGVIGGPVRAIWPVDRPDWLHSWQEGFLTIVDRGFEARPIKEGEWLAGTNIAFRTHLVKQFGGFHEGLGRIGKLLLSNEEIVLCQKIAAAGNQIWYIPDVRVLHRVHLERISQEWMRRRVAFQVLSEIFHETNDDYKPAADIDRVLQFFDAVPARSRSLPGLFSNVQDPEQFQRQTAALAAVVRFCLLDGRDWESIVEANS